MASIKPTPFKAIKKDSTLSFRISKDLIKKARALKIDVSQVCRDALQEAVNKVEKGAA